jgi:SPP1 gp7 family putative phage head morphogenesis protein
MPKKVVSYKAGGKLETTEQTFFKSPYYQSSYDFPYNPDTLCAGNNYNTYDEMRHDDQVKAALSLKKDMVIGTGWMVKCDNEEAKEYIEKNLRNLNDMGLESSFDEVLRDFLSAYDYGFSLGEVIFGLGEDNLYLVKSIKVRPPHSFRFDVDKFGNVSNVIQSTDAGEKTLDPNIFLHFAYQMEWSNPYGTSDLKAAFTPWKIKKFAIRFYAKFLERFVSPIIHGSYEGNGNAVDGEAVYGILNSIQNSTVLVTPDNVKVNFIQPDKGGSDVYERAINHLDLKIARAVLMPDLLGMSGEKTAGGAYALGEKQFQLFLATIKKERELLARKITQKIINPLANANWGIEAEFSFVPYSAGDEMEMAKLWIEAVKTGKFEPTDEEINHIRKISKFPEGEVERPEKSAIASPAAGRQEPEPGMEDEDEGEDVEAEDVKENAEWKPHRPYTEFEKKMDFPSIKKTLDDAERKGAPKIKRAAMKIADSIYSQIVDKKILENWKPESINSIQPKFLKEMNIVFRDHFQDLFIDSLKQAKKEIYKDKKFVDSELLPDEFLEVIEAESFKSVGDYSNDILKRAQNILTSGLKSGAPINVIHKNIKAEMSDFTDKWVNTVVRTKTNESYNSARKIFWETDELAKEIIVGYQYSAVLDDRTSDVCEWLDGRQFEKGEFTDRVAPPLHFNCRSQWVAITRFEPHDFQAPPSIDTLKDKGAHLIYEEMSSIAPFNQPNIMGSGELSRLGDSIRGIGKLERG